MLVLVCGHYFIREYLGSIFSKQLENILIQVFGSKLFFFCGILTGYRRFN